MNLKTFWGEKTAVFEPLHEIVWQDQFAHFASGLLLATVCVLFAQPWLAVCITMAIAIARETLQHPLQCHQGCRTDLLFWSLGSMMVPIILVAGECNGKL